MRGESWPFWEESLPSSPRFCHGWDLDRHLPAQGAAGTGRPGWFFKGGPPPSRVWAPFAHLFSGFQGNRATFGVYWGATALFLFAWAVASIYLPVSSFQD